MPTTALKSFEPAPRAAPEPQREVLEFLSRPESYDHGIASVGRIDTHCSSVFLAGDRAYKLKRAIRFASLNYSTVALRERACRAELRLNVRTAPELYLGVKAITRGLDGGLQFDGPGPPEDWVVAMRRFHQEDIFERMAETGRLPVGLIARLSASVADFHAAAEITADHGGAAAIRAAIDVNRRELRQAGVDSPDSVAALFDATIAELDRRSGLLDRRRREGRVRRCHGDLRLANICLFEGRPVLFDAIEFNDEIGCIDVLYDFAFLLMDLAQRGMDAHCHAALASYLARSQDGEGLAALPLFLSVRAGTRAYALAAKANRAAGAAADGLREDVRRLLSYAAKTLVEMPAVFGP